MQNKNQNTRHNFRRFSSLFLFANVLLFLCLSSANAQCGYGLQLKATNYDYVSGPYIQEISNDFTIEFWIKPTKAIKQGMNAATTGYKDGISGQSYAIWPNWYDGATKQAGAGISVGTNGVAVFEHADAYMPPLLVHYTAISSSKWTHIAVVYKGKQPSLYINGSWVATGLTSTKTAVFPSTSISDNSHYVDYGSLAGGIDEIRVWSMPLNESTIAEWMTKTITSLHPNRSALYSYWKMDAGSGTLITDDTGNGHSGTMVNNPTWGPGWQEDLMASVAPISVSATSSTIYLGYNSPSVILTATGAENVTWSGSNLSATTGANTTFTATSEGIYHITASAATQMGCILSGAIDINVIDVRAPGGSAKEPKIYICHSSSEKNEKSETVAVSISGAKEHLLKHPNDVLGKCASSVQSAQKTEKENEEDSSTENAKERKKVASKNSLAFQNENTEPTVSVYPNPSRGTFNFNIQSTGKDEISLKVYDFTGKVVLEKSDLNARGISSFNMQNLGKGLFHAEITQGAFSKIVKLNLKQ